MLNAMAISVKTMQTGTKIKVEFTVFIDWQTTANQHKRHHHITALHYSMHIMLVFTTQNVKLSITNFSYNTAIHKKVNNFLFFFKPHLYSHPSTIVTIPSVDITFALTFTLNHKRRKTY